MGCQISRLVLNFCYDFLSSPQNWEKIGFHRSKLFFCPSFTLLLLNGLTYDEVVPSSLPDDLLHALVIRRRHPVTNHEDEDELDIVTEVGEGSKEPESSIRKPEPQRQLGKSNPYTGNWKKNVLNNLQMLKVLLTKEQFNWVSEPEFHRLYKGDIIWSEISKEVETSQCLDDFAERSFETEMILVL